MEEQYDGDIILIGRLAEFIPIEQGWYWNNNQPIYFEDIENYIKQNNEEKIEPFGDTFRNPPKENKSNEWHMGRVLYFINHPEEIKDIEIDNMCDDYNIYPVPDIIDGNHRIMAALYLYSQGKLETIHCRYGGCKELLDFLTGKTDECPAMNW